MRKRDLEKKYSSFTENEELDRWLWSLNFKDHRKLVKNTEPKWLQQDLELAARGLITKRLRRYSKGVI